MSVLSRAFVYCFAFCLSLCIIVKVRLIRISEKYKYTLTLLAKIQADLSKGGVIIQDKARQRIIIWRQNRIRTLNSLVYMQLC